MFGQFLSNDFVRQATNEGTPPPLHPPVFIPYLSLPSICEQCQSWQLLARATRVDIEILRNLWVGYHIHMSKATVLARMSGLDRKIDTFRELKDGDLAATCHFVQAYG